MSLVLERKYGLRSSMAESMEQRLLLEKTGSNGWKMITSRLGIRCLLAYASVRPAASSKPHSTISTGTGPHPVEVQCCTGSRHIRMQGPEIVIDSRGTPVGIVVVVIIIVCKRPLGHWLWRPLWLDSSCLTVLHLD